MKEKKPQFAKDLEHEGRDQLFLDVDRIINEGMAGGNVFLSQDTLNIEESRDLQPEEPPNE